MCQRWEPDYKTTPLFHIIFNEKKTRPIFGSIQYMLIILKCRHLFVDVSLMIFIYNFFFFCIWRLENDNRKTRPALSRCPTRSALMSNTGHYFSPVSSKLCRTLVHIDNWLIMNVVDHILTIILRLLLENTTIRHNKECIESPSLLDVFSEPLTSDGVNALQK